MEQRALNCFLSHKCGEPAHGFASRLRDVLTPLQVTLLRDPFRAGDDIVTRIRTVSFDSMVFLSSPESNASSACGEELAISLQRNIPVLVVRLAGNVPSELRNRLYLDVTEWQTNDELLRSLAEAIVAQARCSQAIRELQFPTDPERTLNAARYLFDKVDAALLAESLPRLGGCYRQDLDPSTRFWFCLAIGKSGTKEARGLLEAMAWEDHPYAREGMRMAAEMLRVAGC